MASLQSPVVPELQPGTDGVFKIVVIESNYLGCCWISELSVVVE